MKTSQEVLKKTLQEKQAPELLAREEHAEVEVASLLKESK